jgi:alkanesulfonate monooxygenase SsuD/methylene tetrahydromethanopterin reductase-like flavin-dependent oxidoreductase (luciferase family)
VGVAPGAPKITEKEFETVGVDYHKRGKITDDYIRAVKKLWTEPLPTYDGKFVSFNDVQMFPKPLQKPHPPILIGGGERGLSDIALKRVVGLGNGWIPAYLTEDELEQGAKQLHEGTKKSGRGDEKFIIGLEMFTGLGPSDDAARDTYAATLTKNFVSVEEGMKRSLVGTSKTIAKRMEAYANAGLDYVELKFMYATVSEFHKAMDTFAKDVIPSFG